MRIGVIERCKNTLQLPTGYLRQLFLDPLTVIGCSLEQKNGNGNFGIFQPDETTLSGSFVILQHVASLDLLPFISYAPRGQLSFDEFHKKKNRIYRLIKEGAISEGKVRCHYGRSF
jgi:hypothetical protein